jgi:hypothetical protein
MDNATNMVTPHFLMKLDKQDMAKMSFKLHASDSCGDVCAGECPVNGQKVLVVNVYISPNTLSDNWKFLIFSNLAGYCTKVCRLHNSPGALSLLAQTRHQFLHLLPLPFQNRMIYTLRYSPTHRLLPRRSKLHVPPKRTRHCPQPLKKN